MPKIAALTEFRPGLWVADGPKIVGSAGFHFPTRMVVIPLSDGRLFLWSPIAITDALRAAIDGLGQVSCVIAPNSLHHSFVSEWLQAYPRARLFAAPGLDKVRPDLQAHAVLGDTPPGEWAGVLDQVVMRGNKITTEVVFYHIASRSVLFTDLLQQMPPGWYSGWRGLVARLDLMTGPQPQVPRKFRLAFTGRAQARAALARILDWPAETVLMAHGQPVPKGGQAFLKRAFSWL
jgi:hypothetical protein